MRILVVEANGLQIGFLGCYGNEWIATPNLDRLAAEGVVFDRHILHEPGTSALPGGGLEVHAVRSGDLTYFGHEVLDAWRSNTAEIVWVDGPNLLPPWQLPDELRDVYLDDETEDEAWLDPPLGVVGAATIQEFLELHNTYAAMVTWFDAQLGAIVDDLRTAGDLEQTLLCVTARAGLPLAEHGVIGHGRAWLHEELVHVPLLLRFPEQRFAGLRIDALSQPLDVPATFASVLGRPWTQNNGFDLLPLCEGTISAVRQQARSRLRIGDCAELAVRTHEWAFLLPTQVPEGDAPRAPQLYVKPDDRWEVNDVRQQHPELVDEMEKALRSNFAP